MKYRSHHCVKRRNGGIGDFWQESKSTIIKINSLFKILLTTSTKANLSKLSTIYKVRKTNPTPSELYEGIINNYNVTTSTKELLISKIMKIKNYNVTTSTKNY